MSPIPREFAEILTDPHAYRYDTSMKAIHLRNIPERTVERLKRRARLHHRSLQGELHAILEMAAGLPLPDDVGAFSLRTVRTSGGQDWSREAIYGDEAR
jgi:plasmid stability protein